MQQRKRVILLIAGTPSHPRRMHEYNAGCLLLKRCLDTVPNVTVRVALNGWPKDKALLDGVDAVFLYMDGGGGHAAIQSDHLAVLQSLMQKGVGLGAAHYAVEVPKERGGREFAEWIGGYYETDYSCNPVWTARFDRLPHHPILDGVRPFAIEDEWYFNMRWARHLPQVSAGTRANVRRPTRFTPLLVAKPSDATRRGHYSGPAGPYPHIVAASGREEVLMWAVERSDKGRGFGFTGGHFHDNWGNNNFLRVVLNALLWIAHADVPKGGVVSTVTQADLQANLDPK